MSSQQTFKFRNPWHRAGAAHYGPEFFTTDKKPIEYRGYQIFHRHAEVYELVKDGVCLTQRAGKNGPKNLADALSGARNADCKYNVQRAREIAKRFGLSLSTAEAA